MRSALLLLALGACKGERTQPPPAAAHDAAPAAHDAADATGAGWPELRAFPTAQPAWLVDITPLAPRPELVAHAPVVVGHRVILAGSRTDYRGLDLATGAEAWHRPGGASLGRPAVVAPTDVILVHDCDVAVGAPPRRAVLACYDRIDPLDISARRAGRIHVAENELGTCTSSGGAWKLIHDSFAAEDQLELVRGGCRFGFDLGTESAKRHDDPPPEPELTDDIVAVIDGVAWRQVLVGGKSAVTHASGGALLPGLSVLGAARPGGSGRDASRGAAVVRLDSSLARDYLAAFDVSKVLWVWPLPAPPDPAGRGGPVGVAADDESVFVFFDAGRVARFTAPWAGSTAN